MNPLPAKLLDKAMELRKFGLMLAFLLALLSGVFHIKQLPEPLIVTVLLLAGLILPCALFTPRLLAPLEKALIRLGNFLAPITTRILLTIVYFLVLTPTGLIKRILGSALLETRPDPEKSTYWIPHNDPQSERHERQF